MTPSRHFSDSVRVIVLATIASLGTDSWAEDWPQWMGPRRDGTWNETGLIETFPEAGPKVVWRTPVAGGYSGPAVVGDRVYHTDFVRTEGDARNDPGVRNEVKGEERVSCFDATTGELVWQHRYPRNYKISYPAGPRATPTVDGDRVYTLGAEGDLLCLNTTDGKVIWSKHFPTDYSAPTPVWGFCSHPLIDGEKLICLVGGPGSVVVAFNKLTGEEIWKALSAPDAGYAPPTLIEAGGVRQLIAWHPESINSLDPETGKVYWSIPLKPDYGMSIMAPRKEGDFLFASGIGNVAALLKLGSDAPTAEVAWRGQGNTSIYCSNSTPVVVDGVMYGTDCRAGSLRATEFETGKRLWETYDLTASHRPTNHGTVFLVRTGDRFFLFSETGDLAIARLSAEKYEEISRAHVIEPTGEAFGRPVVWTHPAFANRCAFIRNDKELICVSLAAE